MSTIIPKIFLDDGGVLNDNRRRGSKWEKLIAEWFTSRFGGDQHKWIEGNQIAVEKEMTAYEKMYKEEKQPPYDQFRRYFNKQWIKTMFDNVGIELPPRNQFDSIRIEAQKSITPKAIAPFPGMIDVVNEMYRKYGKLFTASNEESFHLHHYLRGMGIRNKFAKILYGVDVIQTFKTNNSFYEKIFVHSGIDPKIAIIVEDRPKIIEIIEALDVTVIQSRFNSQYDKVTEYVANKPMDLLKQIENIRTDW